MTHGMIKWYGKFCVLLKYKGISSSCGMLTYTITYCNQTESSDLSHIQLDESLWNMFQGHVRSLSVSLSAYICHQHLLHGPPSQFTLSWVQGSFSEDIIAFQPQCTGTSAITLGQIKERPGELGHPGPNVTRPNLLSDSLIGWPSVFGGEQWNGFEIKCRECGSPNKWGLFREVT